MYATYEIVNEVRLEALGPLLSLALLRDQEATVRLRSLYGTSVSYLYETLRILCGSVQHLGSGHLK